MRLFGEEEEKEDVEEEEEEEEEDVEEDEEEEEEEEEEKRDSVEQRTDTTSYRDAMTHLKRCMASYRLAYHGFGETFAESCRQIYRSK